MAVKISLSTRKQMNHLTRLGNYHLSLTENKLLNRTAIICSAGAVFVAFLGLLGWLPGFEFLGSISPHFIPMAPTTSISFILLGLIVLIFIRWRLQPWSKFFVATVAVVLSVLGILELAEPFTGIDVEDFFIPDAGVLALMRKARMSPPTGAAFLLSGVTALLLIFRETKNKLFANICNYSGIVGSLVTITGITILMGYLYGTPLLYGGRTIPMAATTAIGFLLLGVGLVAAAGADRMPIRLLVGRSTRARLLRVFLPLSILIIISHDILDHFILIPSSINSALLLALSVTLFAVITGIIVTIVAGMLGRAMDTAEMALSEARLFTDNLIETANVIIIGLDAQGSIQLFNPAAEKITGYSRQELEGKDWFEVLVPKERYPWVWDEFQRLRGSGLPRFLENPILTKNGEERIISWSNNETTKGGKVVGALSFGVDITEQKKAEKEIRENQRKLRSLASELSLSEERQRHRIATDLHDNTSQELALALTKLQNTRETASGDSLESLNDVCEMMSRVVETMRNITFDISSPTLYRFGLETAVSELLDHNLGMRDGINYDFYDDGKTKSLLEDVKITLFQSVRELVNNIIKHAQACNVTVDIRKCEDTIRITVSDDGVGFKVDELESPKRSGSGFGLFSIAERLKYIGGDFEFESRPGRGSSFTLEAPLEADTNFCQGEYDGGQDINC